MSALVCYMSYWRYTRDIYWAGPAEGNIVEAGYIEVTDQLLSILGLTGAHADAEIRVGVDDNNRDQLAKYMINRVKTELGPSDKVCGQLVVDYWYE